MYTQDTEDGREWQPRESSSVDRVHPDVVFLSTDDQKFIKFNVHVHYAPPPFREMFQPGEMSSYSYSYTFTHEEDDDGDDDDEVTYVGTKKNWDRTRTVCRRNINSTVVVYGRHRVCHHRGRRLVS